MEQSEASFHPLKLNRIEFYSGDQDKYDAGKFLAKLPRFRPFNIVIVVLILMCLIESANTRLGKFSILLILTTENITYSSSSLCISFTYPLK